MLLFYCDLSEETQPSLDFPMTITLEQKRKSTELNQEDLQAMTSFWNSKLARRNIDQRFGQGAVLWLIKSEGRLAGYGWTLRGCTMEPHYFPLGQHDVHLFDFHVFAQYRGRGMNPFLVSHILRSLAADGPGRAFIEAAEWNQAQLSSVGRTPFRCFGYARKWSIFHHTVVWWAGNKTVQQITTDDRERVPLRSRRSGSVRKFG